MSRLTSSVFRSWIAAKLPVLAAAAALVGGSAAAAEIGTIDVDGQQRRYALHLPSGQPAGPLPLVMAFHGGSGTAEGFEAVSRLSEAADQYGFAVVYPDAGDGVWGTYRAETGDPAADLAFIDALVPTLVGDNGLDPDRVFATGLSNGGEFSFLLGLARQDLVAAIAPVGMHLPEDIAANVTPAGPMPLLSIVGFNDPLVLYEDGGPIQTPRGPTEGVILSSEATMEYFETLNGVTQRVRMPLPNTVVDDTWTVRDTYLVGDSGTALERLTVFGGGHTWPGGLQYLDESVIGRTSRDFNANDEIWRFFSGQVIPEPSAVMLSVVAGVALAARGFRGSRRHG